MTKIQEHFQISVSPLIGTDHHPIKTLEFENFVSNNLVSFICYFNICLASCFGNHGRFRLRSCNLLGTIKYSINRAQ